MSISGFGQDSLDSSTPLISKEFKPSLGLGVGVLDYFGDINSNGRRSALNNPLAYELYVYRKINDYSDLGFTFLTGTLIGNQYDAEVPLNFETAINSGSIFYTYNFGHWIDEDAVFHPHLGIGLAFFNFNSKGDFFDASGNEYNYWSDGTIRNISENSPQSVQARIIQRDYFYETDLRNADLDGLGKYSQNAFAFPLTIGGNLRLSDRVNFRLSATFHFTTTDLVDNVSDAGEGARKGNGLNDAFAFYSAGLHYDLLNVAKRASKEDFEFPDFFVVQTADTDQDGVIDEFDFCPFTPIGVQVDRKGCPLDNDNDGVWDYVDKDTTTDASVVVNSDGTDYTAEQKLNWYLRYKDSLEVPIEVLQKLATLKEKAVTYRILVGEYPGKLPEDMVDMFLAEPDIIGALNRNNETAYLVGKYGNLEEAEQRKQALLNKGFPMAEIVVWEGTDYITLEDWRRQSEEEIKERFKDEIEAKEALDGYYAIELGATNSDAHTSEKVPFLEDEDVIVLNQGNGANSFVKGPFIDSVSAQQNLKAVDPEKYPDAKVVRIENGKAVNSSLYDEEESKTVSEDRIAYQEKKKKLKERLSGLEGAFVVDFGKNQNSKVKAVEEELQNDPEVIVVEDPLDGSKQYITKNPADIEKAEKAVEERKEQGYTTAAVAKVENGEIKRLSGDALLREKSKIVLGELEGKEVVDITNLSPEEQKLVEEKAQKSEGTTVVHTVIDESNQKKKIVVTEKGPADAAQDVVEETVKKEAKIAAVQNGRIVEQKKDDEQKPGLLERLNGALVIDIPTQSNKQKIKEVLENDNNVEIVETAEGETKIIDHSANTIEGIEKRMNQLKSAGISDVQPSKVENGKLVPLSPEEIQELKSETAQTPSDPSQNLTSPDLVPSNVPVVSKAKLKSLEDKFVVQLAVIDEQTPEEEKAKVFAQDNIVAVPRKDGSVEVLLNEGFSDEQSAQKKKQSFQKIGIPEAKVAKLDNGATSVLSKEKLDGQFTISLGSFEKDVPNDDIDKILSIPDVQSIETFEPEMTTYTVGNFDDPEEAQERMMELAAQGFKPEVVQYKDGKINKVAIKDVFNPAGVENFNNEMNQPSAIKTNEIVFRVQLGAYRNKISEEVFKGVNTLAFPANGGITKYVTGSFNTYKLAYIHKMKMREMGFSGAFVVAYKDGKRIKVTDLVNQDEYSDVKKDVAPIEQKPQPKPVQPAPETMPRNESTEQVQITYKVQIGAFKDLSEQDKIAQFTEVEMEVYGEYKRFLSGDFNSFNEANKHKAFIQSKGYPNAFVVAYKDGERVTAPGEDGNVIKDNEIEKKNSNSEYNVNKLMIMVQIGLYSGQPPVEVQSMMNELPSITKQVTPHGVVRYMTGNFKNPSEAAAYKERLVEQGFVGPFLVAYYDNERIDIKKAIEIYEGR
jgi:hypothetical protein